MDTYEKKYKEALERAKKWCNAPNVDKIPTFANRVIEEIFPELKESEDNRVRKWLIDTLKGYHHLFEEGGVTKEDMLAWLEKQGEQKEYTFKSIPRLLDMIEPTDRAKAYCQKLIDTLAKEGYNTDAKIVGECLKQMNGEKVAMATMDEQTPADKVEPKFKVGDWVVHDMSDGRKVIRQIVNITNKSYVLDGEDFNTFYFNDLENNYHLWTIQDAKDGDILTYNNGAVEIILLFKEWKNGYIGAAHTYAYVFNNNININNWCDCGENAHPATKEQRDLLFSKMKEAGYEWDSETKKLKKIEQTSVDKVEPKFKVSDWIISNNKKSIYQVIEVKRGIYVIRDNTDNYEYHIGIEECEKSGKLFTIQDAKDGDVLAGIIDDVILMFRGIGNTEWDDVIDYHCYYDCHREDFIVQENIEYWGNIENCQLKPATKEQRDTLFAKMKEAGYEWDIEKKELKKIKQKSVDKVEPKFKDGDWIVFNERTLYIRQVIKGFYRTISKSGLTNIYNWDIDNVARLWTVQDAKDGDVIAEDPIDTHPSSFVCIYKKQNEEDFDTFDSYCFVGFDGKFYENEYGHCSKDIHPATKEQRDLLFQKMKEAGYEWNSDTKKLNDCHRINNNNEMIAACIGMCLTDADEQRFKDYNTNLKECLAWVKNQCEHKKFRDSIQVGDEVTRNSDGVIVNLSQLKRVAKPAQQKLPIEKLPEEMKTIGESLGFTTQEEYDEYNQMVSDLIMSDDNMEEQKSNVENKKLTDVNHEYFSELLENDNSEDINDYAYQVAYCMSHDWLKDNATWEDIQQACKLGAEWKEKQYNSLTNWSKEDEQIKEDILYDLNTLLEDSKSEWAIKDLKKEINWLQSLRPKNQWKPSVVQMEALYEEAQKSDRIRDDRIVSLYNDLKKLKGE